jgi:hypothetical protein
VIKIEDAIEIVLALARENILEDEQVAGDHDLKAEQKKQMEAVNTVEDFFVNVVFKYGL